MMQELELTGEPRERGRQHGEALRGLVAEALERWSGLVADRGQDPRLRVRALAESSPYPATIESRCPELLDEVRGIAEGAAIPFAEALVLNLMDEEWWFRDGEESGCSLIAGRPDGGPPVLAQNMDLPEWMDGLQTVLRIHGSNEHGAESETVLLSAAGMIGLTGMRQGGEGGGVAVGVNTLLQLPRSTRGVPVAFALRSALERPTAEAAAGYLASLPHASGQHYAVIDSRDVLGIECSALGSALRRFDGTEWLLHTNHPLWSDPAVVAGPEEVGIVGIRLHSSHRRLAALETFAESDGSAAGMRATLADRESGVCMVASEEYPTSTFGGVEFSPGRGTARVTGRYEADERNGS